MHWTGWPATGRLVQLYAHICHAALDAASRSGFLLQLVPGEAEWDDL